MRELGIHTDRKLQQLRICLTENIGFPRLTSGFDRYRLVHNALPEIDRARVDTSTLLLGHRLNAPLMISPMTGGVEQAAAINRRLASAAQKLGVAMGVGSQRAAIVDPRLACTYQVRDVAPDILLFANLGAVQLNYGFGVPEARLAVDMIGANALMLHLNPLHEALQPDGDTNFAGLLERIGQICASLSVPVVVKEVGYGISGDVAARLKSVGVAGIDVAGAGGTAWGEVERRRLSAGRRQVAAAFADWGIPTSESIRMVRQTDADWPVIASGGIRTGVDVAKSLALGANVAGLAIPLLRAAAVAEDLVVEQLQQIVEELSIAMFAVGAPTVADLRRAKVELL